MNKGIVFDGKEAELEVRRDDLIRRIEMLIDKGGDAKLAIELTIEASRISKELGYCKDIELVRSGASTSPKKNPTYMNAELERKRLLNEVAPLIRSGNTDDATKMIEEAGKLTGEVEKQKNLPKPEYNNELLFPALHSNFSKGNELVVRKDVPVVTFSEKIVSAAVLPYKDIEYVTEHPFIEDAVLIVGISAILVAISEIFSNQISSYLELPLTIAYVYILWVSISAITQMISSAFGGEGELHPQMTTIVGYSMIPLSIGYALKMILPNSSNEIIAMTLIWSGIILTYGVKQSRNLSISRSMISACALVLWLIMLV